MAQMNNIHLSVVIPAYNEEKRIKKTLNYILKILARADFAWEIIVVDDGSADKTVEAVESVQDKNIVAYRYEKNRGKGYAVNYGFKKAVGEYILFADADNSTPFEEIFDLLRETEHFNVVIGSRKLSGSHIKVKQPLVRRIGARLGNLLIQALLLPGYPDTQCGFKLFSADCAKKIFSRQTVWRWGFDIEILYIAKKLGCRIKQVPVDWYNDERSTIQSPKVFTQTLRELFKIKSNAISGVYKF